MSTERALLIETVERIDGTEIIVEFSDGTFALYTPAELDKLKPVREKPDDSETILRKD